MSNEKYNLNFHETFKPELDNIYRLIEIADDYGALSKEEIFDITGIPTGKASGKVVPSIIYSKYMNLLSYEKDGGKFNLKLTSFGRVIKDEDLYIQEDITKVLLNYFLTSKGFGAKMWFIIMRKIPQVYGDLISLENLNKFINSEFNLMRDTKLGPFLGTYNDLGDFNSLRILDINKEGIKFNDVPINSDYIYAYGYALIVELKNLDSNRIEFNENEIFDELAWHKGFGFNREDGFKVLEILEEKNIIKFNKQLNPITIVLNILEEEIENKIYSLLV